MNPNFICSYMAMISITYILGFSVRIFQPVYYSPAPRRGRGGMLFYLCPSLRLSVRPSKIFFVAFFSATMDGRNLIFGHKLHIGTPYRGKRFWTHQIATSCLPTWLVFIHIEHICGGIISEH